MVMLAVEKEASDTELYQAMGLLVTSKSRAAKPRILSILSLVLNKLIQKNEILVESKQIEVIASDFHGTKAPDVSIQQYIGRIFTYASCSPSCFVIAYIYLDRYFLRRNIYVTSLSAHRLFITSVMVAAKFMDDVVFNNAYYARVGGVSTKELNKLEMTFLNGIDFRLQVTTNTFYAYCLMLESEVSSGKHIERPIKIWGTWSKDKDAVFGTEIA